MVQISANPATVLISFMVFMAYLFQKSLESSEHSSSRRKRQERTARNSSLKHSGASKAQYYGQMEVPGEASRPPRRINPVSTQQQNLLSATRNMILRNATTAPKAMMSRTETPITGIQHQKKQEMVPVFDRNAPLKRQISFQPRTTQVPRGVQQVNPSQFDAQVYASQASGMPPLFVGFLSNEGSMQHIQHLLSSYSKASKGLSTSRKSKMSEKRDRHFGKRIGRFDARGISSSEEMEDEMTEEVVENNRSNKKGSNYLGKRKSQNRNQQIVKTTRGKSFNEKSGEISQDSVKKSLVKLKTDKPAAEFQQPSTPSFSKKPPHKKSGGSALFGGNFDTKGDTSLTTMTNGAQKKEDSKQIGTTGSLFSNMKTEDSKKKEVSGLFANSKSQAPKKEEKVVQQSGSSGLFANKQTQEKKIVTPAPTTNAGSSLFSNGNKTTSNIPAPPSQEKPASKVTTSSIFGNNNVLGKDAVKDADSKIKTSGAGLFSSLTDAKPATQTPTSGTGGLFSNLAGGAIEKSKPTCEGSSLFSNLTSKPAQQTTEKKDKPLTGIATEKKSGSLFVNLTSTTAQPTTSKIETNNGQTITPEKKNETAAPATNSNDMFSQFQREKPTEGSLFANLANNTKPEAQKNVNQGGIFGNNQPTTDNNTSGGLFANTQPATNTIQPQNSNSGGGNSAQNSGNPFLSFTTSNKKPSMREIGKNSGDIFGSRQNNGGAAAGGGIFNASTTSPITGFQQNSNAQPVAKSNPLQGLNTQGASGSLFGNIAPTADNSSTSIFGNMGANNAGTSAGGASIFGNAPQQNGGSNPFSGNGAGSSSIFANMGGGNSGGGLFGNQN